MQLASLFHYIADVDGLNGAYFLGQKKIGQRLLIIGIDFQQNDILGFVLAYNRAPQQTMIFFEIQVAKENLQIFSQRVGLLVFLRERGLIGVERGKSLQLDQAWLRIAAGIAHQSEIYGDKQRIALFAGCAKFGGNGGVGSTAIILVIE